MEIVIAIEELQDKYRNKIDYISENESNVVWNYSKKDLERIEKCLIDYKNEIVLKEKLKNIDDKLEDLKMYIKHNNIKHQRDTKEIINLIEKVYKDSESLDEKYEKLKECFCLLEKLDREISVIILELITLVIK